MTFFISQVNFIYITAVKQLQCNSCNPNIGYVLSFETIQDHIILCARSWKSISGPMSVVGVYKQQSCSVWWAASLQCGIWIAKQPLSDAGWLNSHTWQTRPQVGLSVPHALCTIICLFHTVDSCERNTVACRRWNRTLFIRAPAVNLLIH